jgi:hypothetical protein
MYETNKGFGRTGKSRLTTAALVVRHVIVCCWLVVLNLIVIRNKNCDLQLTKGNQIRRIKTWKF